MMEKDDSYLVEEKAMTRCLEEGNVTDNGREKRVEAL